MSNQVVSGASMFCTNGTAPVTLNVTSQTKTIVGAPAATINDCAPMTNIPPFGNCISMANPATAAATAAALGVFTPGPCSPVPVGTWTVENSNVSYCGSPCLTAGCQLLCGCGGTIKVGAPGQVNLNI